jgi:hypothetical protein
VQLDSGPHLLARARHSAIAGTHFARQNGAQGVFGGTKETLRDKLLIKSPFVWHAVTITLGHFPPRAKPAP